MLSPKDNIVLLPDQQLHRHSQKVGLITDDIKIVIAEMEAAVTDWEASRPHEVGVALAAIQLGKPLRIIVVRNNYDNKDDKTFSVFINPVITKYEGAIEEDFEGCLSVQDIYGKVPRYIKIRLKAQDIDGKEFRMTIDGFLARVLQHEIDHTHGLTFVDRIQDKVDGFYRLKNDGKLEQIDYEKDIKPVYILR
ncbi:MAG TPA: peptide deformylase [Candidatus Saccharimonadales bacterium]|jgi:peptide deformylase|nr:peptide deformylase [Candidatus Saccharimonadales bacterium]